MAIDDKPLERLRQFLANVPPGDVTPEKQLELVQLVEDCWYMFDGIDQEEMNVYKIKRMEDPWWYPPKLGFTIERHGATVLGSTRAELQKWTMDIEQRIVDYCNVGSRQVSPRRAPLDIKPIADEIAQFVIEGKQDSRLRWSGNNRFRISIDKLLGADSLPKQTFEGRRKRLLKALEENLSPYGWKRRHSLWVKTS